ncbi:gata zinc finger domain-containing [Anaeramoeba flamelloides]|uniref:Gata zinc finger domain-containing n=1 Tax=Anaeramoeba flamelloides TaxID=1746091 RepID=A0ABQ8Z4Q1_9EUKA|nr:gata zinc finger domain-containing [Anaeramoeba flamelloides]
MNSKICSNLNCKSTKTPSWRRVNGIIYCNACAIYAKRHNGAMRPVKKKNKKKTANTAMGNNKKTKTNSKPTLNKKKNQNSKEQTNKNNQNVETTKTKTKTTTTQGRFNQELQDPDEVQKLRYAGKKIPQNKKIRNTRVLHQKKEHFHKEKKNSHKEFRESDREKEKEKEKEKETEKEGTNKRNQTKIIPRTSSYPKNSPKLEEMSRNHKTTLHAGDCVGMRLQDGSEIYAIIQLFLKEKYGKGNSFCKVIWLIPKIQSYKTDTQEFNPMELSPQDFIVGNVEPLAQPITCITRKLNFRIDLSTINPKKFENK